MGWTDLAVRELTFGVDFEISTLVCRSLAGTAPVYLAHECTLAAVLCGLLTIEHAWSRGHVTSLVTSVLPTLWNSLPKQLRQPDVTFGQFK